MPATLHDVARLAKVSIKTVSNVVNDHPGASDETRERVRRAIAELDYQPNLSARTLRSGRSGVIGLVVPELSLSYFAQLADAVIARADERGLVVQVEQTGGDADRELSVLSSPRIKLADGVLFAPLGIAQGTREVPVVRYPLVVLGERIFEGSIDHVGMRNSEAAQAATQVLLDAGRRRIAVVGAHPGEVPGTATLRFEGYRSALTAAGLAVDERLVLEARLWHQADGAHAIRRLLEARVPFDGVFAMNDALALGVMRVLQQEGVHLPDDVAVIGFDNIDEGQYSMPSLTTIDPGRDAIARTAVDLLVERIADRGDRVDPRDVRVEFEVVRRESA
ncbi:LacI family transcriptional regulator [Microbacterium sp. HD4P20]|uniref:LacI family DNA-binding transcriptional regulator n=1 Tax=Microbacterium sp. HD4P20 TaxID=2864874 RepID=UPI001C643AFC|nr:LacI family DNA-binding transcriptional regulator [Microbacterium sp. HD4P20]MCP2635836.1 LacI family transcriptional regulator [Microbacterium sp. HD4P20]